MKILPKAIHSFWLLGLIFVPMGSSAHSTPPSQSNESEQLNDQQRKGPAFLMQRCAFCHVPRTIKAGADFKAPSGPILAGLFLDAKPAKEAMVRQIILKGVQGRMPGYEYSLAPDEIEAVIEYMKTLD